MGDMGASWSTIAKATYRITSPTRFLFLAMMNAKRWKLINIQDELRSVLGGGVQLLCHAHDESSAI